MDASVDRKLPNDRNSVSISGKVIGCELSHGSSADLYVHCQMDFASNIDQTKAPQFVDLGPLAINTSDKLVILSTPVTRIRIPTYGFHWYSPDHIFGKATAVRMSAARSYEDYSYKTDFEIWRKN